MRRSDSKTLILIAIFVVPIFCLALAVAGISVGFGITSTAISANGNSSGLELAEEEIEAEILSIAADYARTRDLNMARERLEMLNLPNSGQYISFMVDRYIQEDRGPDDVDTQNLFMLADALGTSTTSMVMILSTPTPKPTPTLPPTDTPTAIPSPTEETAAEVETAAEEVEEVPPTETPRPTPTDTPAPTNTPEPPTFTPTPAPPTNTPEPTPTPEPTQPPIDFVVAEAYLIPNPAYNSCPGSHQIFITVVDINGNPLDGVTVEDTFRAVPPHVSGEKGPGKLEYDLWNNGFSLEVTKKGDGSPASSEVTPKLSSWDEDIPDEWLVQANYCKDMADCAARKSQNQLCRGHYSYNVTFKKTY